MIVNKFELWSALLYSKEMTPQTTELMKWLEANMTSTKQVQIELVEEV